MLTPLDPLLRLKHDFSEMEFTSRYREILRAIAGGWRWEGRKRESEGTGTLGRKAHSVGWLKPMGIGRLSKDPICNLSSISRQLRSAHQASSASGKEGSGTG